MFYGILACTLPYYACYYTIGSLLHCYIFKDCLGEQQSNFDLCAIGRWCRVKISLVKQTL
jgi:hypothetical protein